MSGSARAYYLTEHSAESPGRVGSPGAIDDVVDALVTARDWATSVVILYHDERPMRNVHGDSVPDHQFTLAINMDTAKTGAVRFVDAQGGFVSTGGTGRTGRDLYHLARSDHEFPADAEIPLDLVREAAREFLTSGGRRPTCLAWRQERYDDGLPEDDDGDG